MDERSDILAKKTKIFSQPHTFSFLTFTKVVGVKTVNLCIVNESITDNQLVVFGKYDLIVCYQNGAGELETVYSTKTFAESLSLDLEPGAFRVFKNRRSDVKISSYFSKGPDVRVTPTPNQIMKTLMKLTGNDEWKKLQVEITGEITAEIALSDAKKANIETKEHFEPAKPEVFPDTFKPAYVPETVKPNHAEPSIKQEQLKSLRSDFDQYEIIPVYRKKLNMNPADYEKMVRQLKQKSQTPKR